MPRYQYETIFGATSILTHMKYIIYQDRIIVVRQVAINGRPILKLNFVSLNSRKGKRLDEMIDKSIKVW